MRSIPDTDTLLKLSLECAEYVSKNISDRQNDVRAMCFWNIHNRVRITQEILTFYEMSWKKAGLDINDEDVGEEMTERIITVTKNLFSDIVSSIEKTSKESVSLYQDSEVRRVSLNNRSFLYLRNIVQATFELGLMTKTEFEEWDDILVMRNLVTHNNSISDRSKRFVISDITISMRPGRMMKGPLNTFVILSERIVRLFFDWLRTMDRTSKDSKEDQKNDPKKDSEENPKRCSKNDDRER